MKKGDRIIGDEVKPSDREPSTEQIFAVALVCAALIGGARLSEGESLVNDARRAARRIMADV